MIDMIGHLNTVVVPENLEKTILRYACLAKVVREAGTLVALIARYSVIPSHCEFQTEHLFSHMLWSTKGYFQLY